MRWENFVYLIPLAFVALASVALLVHMFSELAQPSKHRTMLELAILGWIALLGLVAIYWNFYISKTYFVYNIGDAGSDTTEQYYPYYLWLTNAVRTRTLAPWTFEFGLGVSLQTFQSWLFDPFNLIVVPICLAFGDVALSFALAFAQSIKIILSIFLFNHLMTRFSDRPIARIFGALLYGFSGYTIIYGQHYWLGGTLPLFTATILVFELLLERRSPVSFLRVVLIVALQLMWSPYVSFMILLAAAIYLLLRIPVIYENLSAIGYVRIVLFLFVPVICGALLSGVLSLPYINFLINETARTSSSTSLLERMLLKLRMFVHADWIPAILSRLMGSSLINTGSGGYTTLVSNTMDMGFAGDFNYEFYLTGYSGSIFMLLSQFFARSFPEFNSKQKRMVIITTILVLFYCSNEFLPSIFTAMVRTQYRSAFILSLPFCLAAALGFEKSILNRSLAPIPLVLAFLLSLGVLIWSLRNTVNGRLVCLFFLLVTAFVFSLFVLLYRDGSKSNRFPLTAVCLLAASVSMLIVDGLFATNCRLHVEPWGVPRSSVTGDNTATDKALRYLRATDDTFYRIDKYYPGWCPLNDSLIEHFYGVSAYNSSADSDVEDFYQYLWEESISTWAVYSKGFKNAPEHPDILSLLDVKYVLSHERVDEDYLSLVGELDDVFIYENKLNPSLATIRSAVTSESAAKQLPDSAARRDLLAETIIVPDDIAESWKNAVATETPNYSSVFWLDGQDALNGTVRTKSLSIVSLSIPYTAGWSVSVDGSPVETFRTNFGFYGFVISPGTHGIALRYQIDKLTEGIWLSAAGIMATVLTCVYLSKHNEEVAAVVRST